MSGTERIRWEPNGYAGLLGYTGLLTDSDWIFQIWEAGAGAGRWRLSSSLPGQGQWQLFRDDQEELKPQAEHWLGLHVSSLGAVFPDDPATPQTPDTAATAGEAEQ